MAGVDFTFGVISDHPVANALGCDWKPEIRIIPSDGIVRPKRRGDNSKAVIHAAPSMPGAILLLHRDTIRWTDLPARTLHECLCRTTESFPGIALSRLLDVERDFSDVQSEKHSYVLDAFAYLRRINRERENGRLFTLARGAGSVGAFLNQLIEAGDEEGVLALRRLCGASGGSEATRKQQGRSRKEIRARKQPRVPNPVTIETRNRDTFFATLRRALTLYDSLTRPAKVTSNIIEFGAHRVQVF